MTDLALHETGDGGDIQLVGNDLVTTGSIFNQIYMGLFGGNQVPTTGTELETEQRLDWWANALLFQDQPEIQMNSNLEKTFNEVALNSSGRLQIEEAVKSLLAFLSDVADISVETSVIEIDKIQITILAQEPDNIQEQAFIFIWDATKEEIIIPSTI